MEVGRIKDQRHELYVHSEDFFPRRYLELEGVKREGHVLYVLGCAVV